MQYKNHNLFSSPKKKSILRRRLSENSSVYYSNGDNGSISGASIQTRASIHGIENPGFNIISKPPLDASFTDKIILTPSTLDNKPPLDASFTDKMILTTSTLDNKPPLDLPDIHISPMYTKDTIARDDIASEHVYANGVVHEPMSEQGYTEVTETKNHHSTE